MTIEGRANCDRCHLDYAEENMVGVGGKEGYDVLCEDCADQLTWDDEEEDE